MDKAKIKRMLANGLKPHQSQLPPLPTYQTKLKDHPIGKMFQEAKQAHLASHQEIRSWSEVPLKKIKLTGQQILDCMWVYTYKLNKHH
jgi:hypothetical protein